MSIICRCGGRYCFKCMYNENLECYDCCMNSYIHQVLRLSKLDIKLEAVKLRSIGGHFPSIDPELVDKFLLQPIANLTNIEKRSLAFSEIISFSRAGSWFRTHIEHPTPCTCSPKSSNKESCQN